MKSLLILIAAIPFNLSGCIIIDQGAHCPSEQAKKDRC